MKANKKWNVLVSNIKNFENKCQCKENVEKN
jgi:hypothetical protein